MKIFGEANIMKLMRRKIMLNEQTFSTLNQWKLFGMAKGLAARIAQSDHAGLSHAEFVGLLVDDEKVHRENARLSRLLKKARLKQQASLEDIDYRHPRGLNKQVIVELSKGDWLAQHRNILLTGPTGIGKSWLSCAFGNQACRLGYTTENVRFPRLMEMLYASRADGSHLKLLSRLAKVQVLILDDFALAPLTDFERKDFLEIVEDRHGSGSTVITSQPPTKAWHEIIGEPTMADAIVDRLFHQAHKIELKGTSIRSNGESTKK
jgi:DNA replication protein DnaC